MGVFSFLQIAHAAITVDPWVPIFKGIEFARGKADTNEIRLQEVQALRIDLSDPDVELFSTPSNGDAPLETFGQTTSAFVLAYGVKAGVNANFFSPVSTTPNEPREVIGLAISQGNLVSPAEAGREMLLITRSNVATIALTVTNPSNYWTAVAGSDVVVINGVNQKPFPDTEFFTVGHPRTAVGISQNGRYLILLTIDGRQPGYSDGAPMDSLADWLIRFGAYQGLNLDGGGSTAMVKAQSGGVSVLNRASGGVQRVNGNHIGVFTPSLAPVILTAPSNTAAIIGQSASLSVWAGGTTPLRYQWRLSGTNIPGATGTNLSFGNVQPGHSGNYSVIITNGSGTITSAPVFLSANYALTTIEGFGGIIARTPNQPSFQPNTMVSLTAVPDPGFAFIGWSGAHNSTNNPLSFLMTNHKTITATFTGSVQDIIIDNPNATFSGSWSFHALPQNQFSSNYASAATVAIGSAANRTATFRPNIFTPGTYAIYVWHPNDATRSTNAPWSVSFVGGTATTRINQATNGGIWQLAFSGKNFLRGTNGFVRVGNNANGSARVVADAVKFVFGTPPVIASQPEDATVVAGEMSSFSMTTTGSEPFQYQWRFNGATVSNATNETFTITNSQPVHAGNYSLVISNAFGSITSAIAALTVNVPPFINVQPQSQFADQATNVTFFVDTTGTAPLSFQWRFKGVEISGATMSTYTRTNVQVGDGGDYSVLITNIAGSILSSNAILTVNSTPVGPKIFTQPQSQTVIAGKTVLLSVAVNGTLPLHYQWFFRGELVPGANSSTLGLANVQTNDAGDYSVTISNSVDATNSVVANLVVNYSLLTHGTLGGVVLKSPNQTGFAPGSSVTLNAIPNANFIFTGWSGDAGGTSNPIVVMMNANKNIVATFSGSVSDIILDNPSAVYSGDWSVGTTASGRFGADYHFAGSTLGSATETATYRPTITTPGSYNVHIWYPQGSNRASNAPWEISSEEGSDLVLVDQQSGGGGWRLIAAERQFASGTNGFIRLSNNANNAVVIADAVKLSFVLPNGPSTPVLLSSELLQNGELGFTFVGQTGFIYSIESSTNLVDWSPGVNIFHGDESVRFTTAVTNQARFFRARWIP